MLTCCLISLTIFAAFIVGYMIVWRCPESLSATYYGMNHRWLFPATLGSCAALITAPMFEVTPEHFQCLAFLTIAGALFVSASPAFREGLDKPVHYTSAIIMSACLVVWIILMGYIPYFIIAGIIVGLISRKQLVYWFEIGAIVNLYFVLIRELV